MAPVALFDLDDTLVDRKGTYRRWASWFCESYDLPDPAVDWFCEADDGGKEPREALFARAAERWLLETSIDELVSKYRTEYLEHFQPDRVVNDALSQLATLGFKSAIITNGPIYQRRKIERAELTDLVDFICISDEVGVGKPNPMIFEAALKGCGADHLESNVVTMTGDAPIPDIGGGHGMGFGTIWLAHGRSWTIGEFAPQHTVTSISQAVDILVSKSS